VFGSQQTGYYLRKFAWTKIVRHRLVPGAAAVDDPTLTDFWTQRRRRSKPPLDPTTLHLMQAQGGRCPLCQGLLLHADHEPQSPAEWEQWLRATRKAIRKHAVLTQLATGTLDTAAAHLIHTHCQRRATGRRSNPALLPAREPLGPA
jgi:RNA-directed DNA polymerase